MITWTFATSALSELQTLGCHHIQEPAGRPVFSVTSRRSWSGGDHVGEDQQTAAGGRDLRATVTGGPHFHLSHRWGARWAPIGAVVGAGGAVASPLGLSRHDGRRPRDKTHLHNRPHPTGLLEGCSPEKPDGTGSTVPPTICRPRAGHQSTSAELTGGWGGCQSLGQMQKVTHGRPSRRPTHHHPRLSLRGGTGMPLPRPSASMHAKL